jgi:hypothetical protein
MRSSYRYHALWMALLVAAVIAPVVSAVSIDTSRSLVPHGRSAPMIVASVKESGHELEADGVAARANLDAVKLLAVGSVYLGLAALVRRTVQGS